MGGSPPAAYSPYVMAAHGYLMTGVAASSDGLGYDPTTFTSGSIFDLVNDLLTMNTCGDNPYSGITVYSATSSGQPYQTFLDSVGTASCYLNTLYTYSSDTSGQGWLDYFSTLHIIASCHFDWAPTLDAINSLEDRSFARLLREIGSLNAAFAQNNAVFTSSRVIATALATRDVARGVAEEEGKYAFERSKFIMELARQEAQRMVELDFDKFARLGAVAELYKMVSELKTGYERQYIDDGLQIDLQDTMWDLNLQKFRIQALGAPSGLNPMPEQPSPILQAISTALAIGSTVIPWF